MVSTIKRSIRSALWALQKRVAELAVLSLNNFQNKMSALRLGNVLGSHGMWSRHSCVKFLKVVPSRSHIRMYPDILFTTEEAVELILLTSSLEEGGGIFIPHLRAPKKS